MAIYIYTDDEVIHRFNTLLGAHLSEKLHLIKKNSYIEYLEPQWQQVNEKLLKKRKDTINYQHNFP